jgi:hypothetical protein
MKENLYWIVPLVISLLGTTTGYFFSFGKRANQLDTLLFDFKDLRKKVDDLSDNFIRLQTKVNFCLPEKSSDLVKQNSPLTLTEQGVKVRDKINAIQLLDNHKQELYKLLNNTKLYNAYDIQIEAFATISKNFLSLLTSTEMTTLKNEAYLLGKQVEELLVIFQILFRDDILKSKNINVNEIDNYDPKR